MAKTCPLCGTSFPDSAIFCLHDGTSLKTQEESDDLINQTFCDRYVVTKCLGQGGMGAVYLARDVRLPQSVAIKVLRQRTANDAALVARFKQEAEAASRINHDRVARVFDFGFMEDGRAYIVMEYANGKTLKELLDDGPLEPRVAANIVQMIAEGLNAAHHLGILHRDLKPDNVMILNDANSGMRVKVLDFGIAKILSADEGEVKTEAGFVIGTPLWMSPEQLLAEPLDARSDVFALALLAFSMLTGARAFTGGTRQAEMMAPLSSTPRSLQAIVPTVQWPPALQDLITRTLSRNASDRPASALDFANEMSRIVNSTNISASVPVVAAPTAVSSNAKQFTIITAVAAIAIIAVFAYVKSNKNSATTTPPVTAVGDSNPVVTTPPATPTVPSVATADSAKKPNVSVPQPESKPVQQTTPGAAKPNRPDSAVRGATVAATTEGNFSPDVLTLRTLMKEADESLSAGLSDAAKATRARQLIRDIDALKLTAAVDQGWAQLYMGMAHATLNEKPQACNAFDRASKSGSTSRALSQSVDEWQIKLGCPP